MKTLLTIIALVAFAGLANAQTTGCYGWEDGATSLGEFGIVTYSNDGTNVSEGIAALKVAETGSGTGQIYGAWVCGLSEGDQVTASFDVYDMTAGSLYTSTRIWGHYTLSDDINNYVASANGNATYSDGLGWNNLSYTWTVPAGMTCLCVEIRPYGASPFTQEPNWVDNLCVEAPAAATITFPGGTVGNEDESWSGIKAMFR